MSKKPWMTSDDLLESISRKISMPVSQNHTSSDELLNFANEEMFITQVPTILSLHEEYFVYPVEIELKENVSKYPIPDRAIGMKLRDVFYKDNNGNLFEMTRISSDDKAYFQGNTISTNSPMQKFYIESNNVVVTPSITTKPEGSLVMYIYLRPNRLVRSSRAAIICGFLKKISIENAFLNTGDYLDIGSTRYKCATARTGTITNVTTGNSPVLTTSVPHNFEDGFTVVITGSHSSIAPSINGTYQVSVISPTQFQINKPVASIVTGTALFECKNLFLKGVSNSDTASNLTVSINQFDEVQATVSGDILIETYQKIGLTFKTSDQNAINVNNEIIGIKFNSFPSTDIDPATGVSENLFLEEELIDFLQTKPGHKTRAFDVEIPIGSISGNVVYFLDSEVPDDLELNDYVCLAGECIIPQIPPDLHNELAERTCSRVLASLGDVEGLAVTDAKIANMEKMQETLLDNRVTGAPLKINGRSSLLRSQKNFWRRR